MARIADKVSDINRFVEELKSISPSNIKEYKSNIEKKAACERYIEKIVEALTDLAFLIIKIKKLKIPQDDIDAFNILLESRIIDSSLAKRLRNVKGMRNIIAHDYGKIDDEVVFEAITEELEKDALDFMNIIQNSFKLV